MKIIHTHLHYLNGTKRKKFSSLVKALLYFAPTAHYVLGIHSNTTLHSNTIQLYNYTSLLNFTAQKPP